MEKTIKQQLRRTQGHHTRLLQRHQTFALPFVTPATYCIFYFRIDFRPGIRYNEFELYLNVSKNYILCRPKNDSSGKGGVAGRREESAILIVGISVRTVAKR